MGIIIVSAFPWCSCHKDNPEAPTRRKLSVPVVSSLLAVVAELSCAAGGFGDIGLKVKSQLSLPSLLI